MRVPMAADSRRLNPVSFAATEQPKNLETKATTQMRTTYPQVMPVLSVPRLVFNPDKAKYWSKC